MNAEASTLRVVIVLPLPLSIEPDDREQAGVERARVLRIALLEAPGLGEGHGPMGQGQVRLDVGGSPRLNQVTVTGKDYAKQVAFYTKLGLTQIVDSPENGYARFEAWGGVTFSVQIDPEEAIAPTGRRIELASSPFAD